MSAILKQSRVNKGNQMNDFETEDQDSTRTNLLYNHNTRKQYNDTERYNPIKHKFQVWNKPIWMSSSKVLHQTGMYLKEVWEFESRILLVAESKSSSTEQIYETFLQIERHSLTKHLFKLNPRVIWVSEHECIGYDCTGNS